MTGSVRRNERNTLESGRDMRMEDICITNLSKSYGVRNVFEDLNIRIKSGAMTCIMAPSGAGKTTLLRILMGLEKADSGVVTGLENKRFSAVFQEERLCENMTAQDNVRLVLPKTVVPGSVLTGMTTPGSQTVRQEMTRLGLTDCYAQPVSELSGGMRRRVSILRALLAEYDVLFLDEPFKGLDDTRKEQVIAYVKEKTRGKTVIFVTHDQKEALDMGASIIQLL